MPGLLFYKRQRKYCRSIAQADTHYHLADIFIALKTSQTLLYSSLFFVFMFYGCYKKSVFQV